MLRELNKNHETLSRSTTNKHLQSIYTQTCGIFLGRMTCRNINTSEPSNDELFDYQLERQSSVWPAELSNNMVSTGGYCSLRDGCEHHNGRCECRLLINFAPSPREQLSFVFRCATAEKRT